MLKIVENLTGLLQLLCFIVNLLATEAMKIAADMSKLPVYYSQNIDGFDNEALYDRYKERIKHL